jgi:hypothetical protein
MFLNKIASPFNWNSLHSEEGINYKFSYNWQSVVVSNNGGFVQIRMSGSNLAKINVGDIVECSAYSNWPYKIHHVTRVINNTDFVISAPFVSGFGGTQTWKIYYRPLFELWTGTGSSARPIKMIANIYGQANIYDSYRVSVNVAEFLKKDFPISEPKLGVDPQLINTFWLTQRFSTAVEFGKYRAVNSAVSNEELQKYTTGVLNDYKPRMFNCAPSIYSAITPLSGVTTTFSNPTRPANEPRFVDVDEPVFELENGKILTTEAQQELRLW